MCNYTIRISQPLIKNGIKPTNEKTQRQLSDVISQGSSMTVQWLSLKENGRFLHCMKFLQMKTLRMGTRRVNIVIPAP